MHLGIQLHFVFDGGKRLGRGRKLYPGHDEPSELLRETLTNIGVPWHQAPAEAEAECAKMEMEEVVDGVWSEDGDALAFGCQTLIKSRFEMKSSTERRKSFTHFKVYKLDDIARQHTGMDREGFVLYAILNGEPKDTGELYNLKPQDVLNAARQGLGKSLCAASRSSEKLRQWATTDFAGYLKDTSSKLKIPPEFPRWEPVQHYLTPVASTRKAILDLPQPLDPFVNEEALFTFLQNKFQFSIGQWVKHIVPVRIVRSLLATKNGQESQHDYLKLECDPKKSGAKKVKATFLHCKATSLNTSEIIGTRGDVDTLLWILRKANCNEQRKIASYFLTPDSGQKGKSISSALTSEKPFQRLDPGANGSFLAQPSGLASNSSGDGPSKRKGRSRRLSTPPSPTPLAKRCKPPLATGTSITKNIQRTPKNDYRTSAQTKRLGSGKAEEILAPLNPSTYTKRARSPTGSNRTFNEVTSGKRPKLAPEQLPSTPPAQIAEPADTDDSISTIEPDSDYEYGSFPSTAAKQLPSTPPDQITGPANAINRAVMIDSDSDGDVYGSFPSAVGDTVVRSIHDEDLAESSSSDYGSLPPSPDIRALL